MATVRFTRNIQRHVSCPTLDVAGGTLREVLLGPARVDDGTQNLVGALRSAMGVCGARTLAEFQHTELVIAPAIQSEGKLFQQAQQVGMGS